MSTKPTQVAVWAESSSNIEEPSDGLKAAGWDVNQIPTSGNFNWNLNLLGLWTQYLSDGVFHGAVEFVDAVEFDSNVEFDADVDVDGNLNCHDDVIVDADKDINLQGLGKINHGDKHWACSFDHAIWDSTSAGGVTTVVHADNKFSLELSDNNTVVRLSDLPFKPGDRIKSMRLAFTSGGGAPVPNLREEDFGTTFSGPVWTAGVTDTFDGISICQYTPNDPLEIQLDFTTHYFWAQRAVLIVRAGTAGINLYAVDFTYDSKVVTSPAP